MDNKNALQNNFTPNNNNTQNTINPANNLIANPLVKPTQTLNLSQPNIMGLINRINGLEVINFNFYRFEHM